MDLTRGSGLFQTESGQPVQPCRKSWPVGKMEWPGMQGRLTESLVRELERYGLRSGSGRLSEPPRGQEQFGAGSLDSC